MEVSRTTPGPMHCPAWDVPPLAEWFVRAIDPRPSRELADDVLPQPKDRAVWFLAAGLVFLVLSYVREA